MNQASQKLFIHMLILFLLLFENNSSAQSPSQDPNWTYDTIVNGVEFYHAIVYCNGKNVIFLKFNNKNNYTTSVSWKEMFETQVDAKVAGFAGRKEIIIPKGITMPENCSDISHKKNIILPSDVSPMYVAQIKKFDFKDINVAKAN